MKGNDLMPNANLVIQTAFLGDLILSVPVLRRIKEIYPGQKLIVVCKQGVGEFLITEKIVDQIIEVEKSNATSYRLAREELNKFDINHIFCLHKSLRSLLFVKKIKAIKKIGFKSFLGNFVFDEQVQFVKQFPEVIRQFRILETVDQKSKEVLNSKDFSYLNQSELPDVPEFFSFKSSHNQKLISNPVKIAVFPGSVWATKKWTRLGFNELCLMLVKQGFQVDLLGGPSEKPICDEIAKFVPECHVIAGKLTVAQTISTISQYDLVVTNDSAPTHMSAFKNVPVVTIFGPTVPLQGFRPWSNRAVIVENKEISCRPCGRHGHNQCPLGHHNCMNSIKAETVYKAALKLLSI